MAEHLPGFPEEFGQFKIYSPEITQEGWCVSWDGMWLPVVLADRDACLVVLGLVIGGVSDDTLAKLRNEHNRADPSVSVTVQMIQEHMEAMGRD